MSNVIYGNEVLSPTAKGLDYDATRLMLEGSNNKIFIMPEQRDDSLEGYGHGFILEINGKRIGCYWQNGNEFEIDDEGTKVWNLDVVGIEPSMSSTNQFTTHRLFSSRQEMQEGLNFISTVFGEYDGAETTALVDDEVVMVWNKKRACRLNITDALSEKMEQGDLLEGGS